MACFLLLRWAPAAAVDLAARLRALLGRSLGLGLVLLLELFEDGRLGAGANLGKGRGIARLAAQIVVLADELVARLGDFRDKPFSRLVLFHGAVQRLLLHCDGFLVGPFLLGILEAAAAVETLSAAASRSFSRSPCRPSIRGAAA